jgi:SAM-dependent methyltransferase
MGPTDDAELRELSKRRWRGDELDRGLTWGRMWDGSAFIRATQEHCRFSSTHAILEVGPGYGRMLDQILHDGLPFASYLGLDLSSERIARLTEKYRQDERIAFLCGDVETTDLGGSFDLCLTSATLSHLYPSCAKAVQNIARHLRAEGVLTFDVAGADIPGWGFQADGRTFGRTYTIGELTDMITGTGLGDLTARNITHGVSVDGSEVTLLFVAARRFVAGDCGRG